MNIVRLEDGICTGLWMVGWWFGRSIGRRRISEDVKDGVLAEMLMFRETIAETVRLCDLVAGRAVEKAQRTTLVTVLDAIPAICLWGCVRAREQMTRWVLGLM